MTYFTVVPRRRNETTAHNNKRSFNPHVDIIENKDLFALEFDLPGINKDDVKISVNEGVLTVSGDRKREVAEDDEYFRHFERAEGSFSRSFRLPEHVNGDDIKAAYTNGVLSLELPKREEAKPHTIEIK